MRIGIDDSISISPGSIQAFGIQTKKNKDHH
jgi:hypothetical protein